MGGGPNTVYYKLPSTVNSRGNPAMITDVGLPYFVHLTADGKYIYFDPPYSEGPGLYNISIRLERDGVYAA